MRRRADATAAPDADGTRRARHLETCAQPAKLPAFFFSSRAHSMTMSMYKVSIPIFVQHLTALSAVLDKAVAHIEAKQLDAGFFLTMRLYPDMYPLVRQVQQATSQAMRGC